MNALTTPTRLWTRDEVLSTEAVPRSPGVYAWYFRETPPSVPTEGCIVKNGLTLLYVGIAPKAPPKNRRKPSKTTLRSRLRDHMRGNAFGSTVRLTLGCLMSERLGITLQRVGSGERLTFADGEVALSDWLAENAFVCWAETDRPWEAEESLIRSLYLPLNLAQNKSHPFHAHLSACRAAAKTRARAFPIPRSHI